MIFPVEYYWLKKDSRSFIWNELLFNIQDGKGNCIGPGLLFYYKKMPANLLANQYTLLKIISDIRVIVNGVIPNPEGEFELVTL